MLAEQEATFIVYVKSLPLCQCCTAADRKQAVGTCMDRTDIDIFFSFFPSITGGSEVSVSYRFTQSSLLLLCDTSAGPTWGWCLNSPLSIIPHHIRNQEYLHIYILDQKLSTTCFNPITDLILYSSRW